MGEEIIVGSRGKAVGMGLVSVVFAVFGVAAIQGDVPGVAPIYGWISFVVFGALGAPVFMSMAFRPRRLILQPERLVWITTFGRRLEIPWAEIEDFFVWRIETAALVGYRLHEPNRPIYDHAQGAIRTLGGSWMGGTDRVVEQLNRYHAEALGRA